MTDKIREALSAMMDGEANEFEVHQVLRACEDPGLSKLWSRFHDVRTVIDPGITGLAPAGLSEAIFAALDSEVAPRQRGLAAWATPLRGLAVAATVAVVAVLGIQGLPPADPGTVGGSAATVAAVDAPLESAPVYQPGLFRGGSDRASYAQAGVVAVPEVPLAGELGTGQLEAQHRLQEFMYRHAEYASLNSSRGMMPFARVASQQSH